MKIVVFGDSITQGLLDTEQGGWASRLNTYVMKRDMESDWKLSGSVLVSGIGGDCTSRLLKRFSVEAKARFKDKDEENVAVFFIGVNDTQRYVEDGTIKTSVETFQANLGELAKEAKLYSDRIFFLGILPIDEKVVQPMPWASDRGHYAKDVVEYDSIIKEFCESNDLNFIPMQDLFGEDSKSYLVDGIHPDAEGHKLIFERVKEALEMEGIL